MAAPDADARRLHLVILTDRSARTFVRALLVLNPCAHRGRVQQQQR
jgi:hypothetical protein